MLPTSLSSVNEKKEDVKKHIRVKNELKKSIQVGRLGTCYKIIKGTFLRYYMFIIWKNKTEKLIPGNYQYLKNV